MVRDMMREAVVEKPPRRPEVAAFYRMAQRQRQSPLLRNLSMVQFLSRISWRKVSTFALVGCLAGGTYAALYFLFSEYLHLPVFISSVIAFCAAIPVSYFGNRKFTFESQNVVVGEMTRFIVVQMLNLVVTSAAVHFASASLPINFYIEVVIAVTTAPIVSFILFEIWVYRPRGAGVIMRSKASNPE